MKVKKKTETEIEIPDGYYKDDNHIWKVDKDKIALRCYFAYDGSINLATDCWLLGNDIADAAPIDENQFKAELEKAFEIIREKI